MSFNSDTVYDAHALSDWEIRAARRVLAGRCVDLGIADDLRIVLARLGLDDDTPQRGWCRRCRCHIHLTGTQLRDHPYIPGRLCAGSGREAPHG